MAGLSAGVQGHCRGLEETRRAEASRRALVALNSASSLLHPPPAVLCAYAGYDSLRCAMPLLLLGVRPRVMRPQPCSHPASLTPRFSPWRALARPRNQPSVAITMVVVVVV